MKCTICGDPADDDALVPRFCSKHRTEYVVHRCGRCGRTTVAKGSVADCGHCWALDAFEDLPDEVRSKIDFLLKKYAGQSGPVHTAIGDAMPGVGLHRRTRILVERLRVLDLLPSSSQRSPDINAIAETQRPLHPVAVEARWDGDTNGWFVDLEVITARASQLHPEFTAVCVATFSAGSDMRVLVGGVPSWPEAKQAVEAGQLLASKLGVPFYFHSPEQPDDESPRWWSQIDHE